MTAIVLFRPIRERLSKDLSSSKIRSRIREKVLSAIIVSFWEPSLWALKYDPTTDTETGLLFDGYIDVDAASEDGTNTQEEQPGAPQEETPRLVTPQGAVPPTNKAQEAAASIKSSVAGRRTRRTVAKQPEPVEPSTESAPESPQPARRGSLLGCRPAPKTAKGES